MQVISLRYGVYGKWSPNESVNTQVRVPSGGDRREPQRLNS